MGLDKLSYLRYLVRVAAVLLLAQKQKRVSRAAVIYSADCSPILSQLCTRINGGFALILPFRNDWIPQHATVGPVAQLLYGETVLSN
jgi:hypothetical protein